VKVILTDQALGDLIAIGRYIQQDNPTRAVTFIAELEEKCAQMAERPKLSRSSPAGKPPASGGGFTAIT